MTTNWSMRGGISSMSYDFESFRKALTEYSLDANKAVTLHTSEEGLQAWQRVVDALDDDRRAALSAATGPRLPITEP